MRHYFKTFTASGADLTSANHGLYEHDTVVFETSSALPTEFSLLTTYYVVQEGITEDTFQVSASEDGTPITTTGAGTGTHKFLKTNRDAFTVPSDRTIGTASGRLY